VSEACFTCSFDCRMPISLSLRDIDLDKILIQDSGDALLVCWRLVPEESLLHGHVSLENRFPVSLGLTSVRKPVFWPGFTFFSSFFLLLLSRLVPEFNQGKIFTKASDWFLLGLVLYQLFCSEVCQNSVFVFPRTPKTPSSPRRRIPLTTTRPISSFETNSCPHG